MSCGGQGRMTHGPCAHRARCSPTGRLALSLKAGRSHATAEPFTTRASTTTTRSTTQRTPDAPSSSADTPRLSAGITPRFEPVTVMVRGAPTVPMAGEIDETVGGEDPSYVRNVTPAI